MLGYWRSVGNSINDFMYEAFLDEVADAGGQDPYELRAKLLQGNERLSHLLKTVADLSGGGNEGRSRRKTAPSEREALQWHRHLVPKRR